MRRLLLLLVLLLPFTALAQEETDKDFLTRLLERSLSGGGRQVEIEGFSGALSSEERRVGKECLRLCRSRWSPYH